MSCDVVLNLELFLDSPVHCTELPRFIRHFNKFSLPFNDIKVVSVVSLVDDVLLSLNPRLEHGVQHL